MAGCDQLRRSRSTGKAGEENTLAIGMIAAQHFVNNRHQVAVVIDRQRARREAMSTRAFHFPEGDVGFTVQGLISLGGDRLGEDDEESVAVGLRRSS